MSDSTVSALTAASALDGTELYYVAQAGADRKATGTQIKTMVLAAGQVVGIANNANTSVIIPAGYMIASISLVESAGHAVTGGVDVTVTGGGSGVLGSVVVGANAAVGVYDADIIKKMFSGTVATTLDITPGTSWNGAVVRITFNVARGIA